MRKQFIYLGVFLLAVIGSSQLKADPIKDNIVYGYKAAWKPSVATPCAQVCRRAHGARAEGEAFFAPKIRNRATYVCKVKSLTHQGKGFLYGNNFSSPLRNKLCLVSTPSGHVQRAKKFHCLCVY